MRSAKIERQEMVIRREDQTVTVIQYINNKRVLVQSENGETYWTTWRTLTSTRSPRKRKSKVAKTNSGVGYGVNCSLPEYILLYYMEPYGFRKYPRGYWKQYHPKFGNMELDLFHSELLEGYEYDGIWHLKPEAIEVDKMKEILCASTGIKLVKLRDSRLPMDNHPNAIVINDVDDMVEYENIVKTIVTTWTKQHNVPVAKEVNFARDMEDITTTYSELYNPHNRVGKTVKANCGIEMTIIKAVNNYDMTVRFANGEIKHHVQYSAFLKGQVAPPSMGRYYMPKKDERLHQVGQDKQGDPIRIIRYASVRDIDVQWEDGTIAYNCRYDSFTHGTITKENATLKPVAPNVSNQQSRILCPSKDEMLNVYKQYKTVSRIANYYGVGCSTVSNWCKRLNIPLANQNLHHGIEMRDMNGVLVKVFETYAEAERYAFGKSNGQLRQRLYKSPCVECGGYQWQYKNIDSNSTIC